MIDSHKDQGSEDWSMVGSGLEDQDWSMVALYFATAQGLKMSFSNQFREEVLKL